MNSQFILLNDDAMNLLQAMADGHVNLEQAMARFNELKEQQSLAATELLESDGFASDDAGRIEDDRQAQADADADDYHMACSEYRLTVCEHCDDKFFPSRGHECQPNASQSWEICEDCDEAYSMTTGHDCLDGEPDDGFFGYPD